LDWNPTRGSSYTNELTIEATPGPLIAGAPTSAPAPAGLVGVAVGDLELSFLAVARPLRCR
jgi:hypothetical protein